MAKRGWKTGLCCLLLWAMAARPTVAEPKSAPHSSVELVSESATIAGGRDFTLGLLFRLDPQWHIYWVNPGDSGEPPRISWQLPPGFSADPLQWPTPRRLPTGTLIDYGYEQQVLLPVRVHAPAGVSQPIPIHAAVKWLVCKDLCLPAKANVDLLLAAGPKAAVNPQAAPLFRQAREAMPRPFPKGWRVSVEDAKDEIRLRVNSAGKLHSAVFFPLDASVIEDSSPQQVMKSASGFTLTLKKSDQFTGPLTRLRGVLADSDWHSYAISVPVASPGGRAR